MIIPGTGKEIQGTAALATSQRFSVKWKRAGLLQIIMLTFNDGNPLFGLKNKKKKWSVIDWYNLFSSAIRLNERQ
jgi:hypothetical protein